MTVTFLQLLRFYLPLSVRTFLFSSLHSIVNAAIARLPDPELHLSVLTVTKSLTNTLKAPDLVAQQMSTALVADRRSFRTVTRFTWAVGGTLFAMFLVLGYTPAGGWILQNLLGMMPGAQISLAYTAIRLMAIVPLAETLRSSMQGLAIGLRRSHVVPIATAIRFVAIALFLWWVVRAQALSGVAVGGLAWSVGLTIEGVFLSGFLVKRFGSLGLAAERIRQGRCDRLTTLDVARFFAPLATMMLLSQAIQPILQSGLARGVSPTSSLAAYGVAWDLMWILTGPILPLHQCSLVYTRGTSDPNWPRVRRFCLVVGLAMTGLTMIFAITPAGSWLLGRVMAIPETVAQGALETLVAFSPFPLIRAWREAYWGVLMRRRSTSVIGAAKLANLVWIAGVALFAFGPIQSLVVVSPAALAALTLTLGEGWETVVVWRYCVVGARRSRD